MIFVLHKKKKFWLAMYDTETILILIVEVKRDMGQKKSLSRINFIIVQF